MEEKKKKPVLVIAIVSIILILFVLSLIVLSSVFNISNDESLTAKILSIAALEFKDPSSLRLISGELDKTTIPTLYATTSAKNGFGARTTGIYKMKYFKFSGDVTIYEGDTYFDDGDYDSTTNLNIGKVNKKLKRLLSQYE